MKPRLTLTTLTSAQRQMLKLFAANEWTPFIDPTQEQLDTVRVLHRARLVDESHHNPPAYRVTNAGRRLLGPSYQRPHDDEPEAVAA